VVWKLTPPKQEAVKKPRLDMEPRPVEIVADDALPHKQRSTSHVDMDVAKTKHTIAEAARSFHLSDWSRRRAT
jgi:hypothetical protein